MYNQARFIAYIPIDRSFYLNVYWSHAIPTCSHVLGSVYSPSYIKVIKISIYLLNFQLKNENLYMWWLFNVLDVQMLFQ